MDSLFRVAFPFLIPGLMSLAGCSSKPAMDPAEVQKLQARLVLAEEPDGAQTVSDVRLAMLGEERPNVLALLEEGDEHAAEATADEEHTAKASVEAETEEPAAHDHAGHDHAGHDHAGHDHTDHDHAAHEEADGATPKAPLIEEMDVVLVGVVGGIPNPSEQSQPEFPFAPGQAMFFLADPEAVAELEEHGHQHAPGEECAFCAAHAADAMALIAAVTFMDEQGKVLPVDVRDLFGLKEKDVVVVKGKCRVKSGGILSVDATELYVRR